LNLVQHDSCANGVDRTGRHQHNIADLDWKVGQVVLNRSIARPLPQLLWSQRVGQPVHQFGAWVSIQNVPSLGLAERFAFQCLCLLVVRVDLDGKLLRRVDGA